MRMRCNAMRWTSRKSANAMRKSFRTTIPGSQVRLGKVKVGWIVVECNAGNKKKKTTPPFSWCFSAHKRPAASVSRQGVSSPKIDWYHQSTCGQA
jgi:hypothetical protein